MSSVVKNPTPIKNRVSGVFIPVRNIERARAWYNRILGLEGGEILFGHLYCPPMQGSGLVLDAKASQTFSGDDDFPTYRVPAFMFATDDIQAAYRFMQENAVELVTGVENGHWFVFKDPDGNLLMVCQ